MGNSSKCQAANVKRLCFCSGYKDAKHLKIKNIPGITPTPALNVPFSTANR